MKWCVTLGTMSQWKLVYYGFKIICVIATLALISMWIKTYFLDTDIPTVETRNYFDTNEDVVPVMSLCFEQEFDSSYFASVAKNISGSNYKYYLLGRYYDANMQKIDYDMVTTNLSKYLLSQEVKLRNLTSVYEQDPLNSQYVKIRSSHSWHSWGKFVKCFGFEIINQDALFVRIYMKRDIFPDRARPQAAGFVLLYHYPNQILSSFHTVKRQWGRMDNLTNYMMSFNIRYMQAVRYRYKPSLDNCIQDYQDYDEIVLKKHLMDVGCKAPDQITRDEMKICKTKEEIKKARFLFSMQGHTHQPCRKIEWLDLEIGESDHSDFIKDRDEAYLKKRLRFPQKYWNNYWGLVVRLLTPRFKLITHQKEVDFQTLVGYVGGYIGILLGFALVQLPDAILSMWLVLRKLFHHKTTSSKIGMQR